MCVQSFIFLRSNVITRARVHSYWSRSFVWSLKTLVASSSSPIYTNHMCCSKHAYWPLNSLILKEIYEITWNIVVYTAKRIYYYFQWIFKMCDCRCKMPDHDNDEFAKPLSMHSLINNKFSFYILAQQHTHIHARRFNFKCLITTPFNCSEFIKRKLPQISRCVSFS